MDKARVCVIGTGFIGPVHVEAVRRTCLAEVVAVCGTDPEKIRKKADELGVEKAYADYREAIADPEIDVVHICTPNNLHFEIAKSALLAGKHVVCEKPLALSAEECDELIALGRKADRVCAVNFNYRCYPMIQQIREMIRNGELGTIFSVTGSYTQDWLMLDTDYSWRIERKNTGDTRTVADIGSHWFDMAEYMTGMKVSELMADFAIFHKTRKRPRRAVDTFSGKKLQISEYDEIPVETEDYSTILFHMGENVHGSCTTCQTMAGRKNRCYFEIAGSKAMVVFDSEHCNDLWIGRRESENGSMIKDASLMHGTAAGYASYPGGHNEGFADTVKQHMIRIYEEILYRRQTDHARFEDGKREIEISDAAYRSAMTRQWVKL